MPSAAQRRAKRLEDKIAEEEAKFAESQEQLGQAQTAVAQIEDAMKVRAGRISALREELEA